VSALDDALASINGGNGGGWGPPSAGAGGGDNTPLWAQYTPKRKEKKKGLFGGNLLSDAFQAVSLPLHAVTSGLTQESRAIGGLFGKKYGTHNYLYIDLPNGKRQSVDAEGRPITEAQQHAEDTSGSFGNFVQGVIDPEKQIDFADYVNSNNEKAIGAGLFAGSGNKSILPYDAPGPVRFAAGLAGDIGLDPLSFIAPAGEVHGAAEAASHITETASKQIGELLLPETGGKMSGELIHQILTKTKPIDEIVKVSPETALKVEEIRNAAQDAVYAARRGGPSALTAGQLDQFGQFTNEAGITKSLEKGLNLDFGRLGSIKLTSGEGPLSQFSILRHKAEMSLGDLLLGKNGVPRGLGKLNGAPDLNAAARSGAARRVGENMSMMDATLFKRLRATTRAISETATRDAQRTLNEAVKGFTDEEIAKAHEIIDTGGQAAAQAEPRVQELAKNISDAQKKLGDQLVAAGVLSPQDLIQEGGYFPSPITKDTRDALVAAGLHPAEGGTFDNVRGFIEGQRKLWDESTGIGGIGRDTETSQRITFKAATRAEAEKKASKILAEQLKKAADEGSEAAKNFIGEHPEAVQMLEDGEYPLFQEGREALRSQTRAMGRRIGQARAGRKLFEAGYGLVDPRVTKGFVNYGPTAEEVQRMLRLGGQASEDALDRAAAAREMEAAIKEMGGEGPPEGGAGGISPERPPEGPVSPAGPVAPNGATLDLRGSEAGAEARLAGESGQVATAAPPAAPTGPSYDFAKFMEEAQNAPPVSEDVIAGKAAKVEAIRSAAPPLDEGKTRLWNSGGTNWWMPEEAPQGDGLAYVAGFPGTVRHLDVDPAEFQKLKQANQLSKIGGQPGSIVIDETLNPELTSILNKAEDVSPLAKALPTAEAAPVLGPHPGLAYHLGGAPPDLATALEELQRGQYLTVDEAAALMNVYAKTPTASDLRNAAELMHMSPDLSAVDMKAAIYDQLKQATEGRVQQGAKAHPPIYDSMTEPFNATFHTTEAVGQNLPEPAPLAKAVQGLDVRGSEAAQEARLAGGAPRAQRAAAAARGALTRQQVLENMHQVEGVMDDVRAYLKNRTVFKGSTPVGKIDPEAVTAHFDQLKQFAQQLQLDEPSSFGYRDPLAALEPAGYLPTGGNAGRTGFSVQEQANRLEKLLKSEVKKFEAEPDVYAAKTRARIEGHLAEEANRARVGSTKPFTELVQEPRRPWTFEEKEGHKAAVAAVKTLGEERGRALQELKAAKAEVAAIGKRGATVVSQDTANVERDIMLLEQQKAMLQRGLEQKQELDAADAARTAEQQAYESPVGGTEDLVSENLPNWAERNAPPPPEGELTGEQRRIYEEKYRQWEERQGMPIDNSAEAQYQRENAQKATTRRPRPALQTDRGVDNEVRLELERLDAKIERLKRVGNIHGPGEPRKGPVTDLDIAKARVEDAARHLDEVNTKMETAKAGIPPRENRYYAPSSGKQVERVVEGSAYDEALKKFHEEIAALNARAVEPHLESREQWNIGDTPFRDAETGLTIREGTLSEATGALSRPSPKEIRGGHWVEPRAINGNVVKARAEKILAEWKKFGQTANDHSQMRDAFAAYKGQLDKAIKPSVERDMVVKAERQVDAVSRLAQSESHVQSIADDLTADAQAVQGVSNRVVPEQVQVNFEQRAAEGQELVQESAKATAMGAPAAAEIAHMRLIANHLANDADMYRANAREWLSEWNSITEERRLHSAVNSLLVQGQFDWLAHTSLQRGILTPRSVVDAIMYTEKLAQPETQNRLADSWRKALHWMRVWQITSPGFHVRNLFGGIFNNALAGVDASTYPQFASLWRKAASGGELTAEERKFWGAITSIVTPGQIGSEALGNPEARLMGEAAVSKTPWGQLGTHGVLPRISENSGANVEFYLRGSLAYDTLKKGGTLDDAVEAINKFHFDYHDASAKEQWLKANAIPFLTWTRHNVPLQLQMMVENPKTYARFAHFQNNVEYYSKADPVIPAYFADIQATRLPFTTGGGHTYYIPDLPFRDVGLATEPLQQLFSGQGDLGDRALAAFGEPVSQTTPLISGPIEWMLGKQFFKGIPLRDDRGIKLHDLHIPEWLAAPLRLTPLVKRGANGQSYITEKDFYILEKTLPILGRARRLGGSSETKQQNKLLSHLISFFAGTQIRTNTLEDQKIANYLSTLETKRRTTINNGLQGP